MLDIIKNLLVTYLMRIILDFSCDGAKKTREGFLRKTRPLMLTCERIHLLFDLI